MQHILTYCLDNREEPASPLTPEKFGLLFHQWLAVDPEGAIAWYEDDSVRETLRSVEGYNYKSVVEKHLADHYIVETQDVLSVHPEYDPIHLVPLFKESYYNPPLMCALISNLLDNATTETNIKQLTDKIIRSGILHQYFMANYALTAVVCVLIDNQCLQDIIQKNLL